VTREWFHHTLATHRRRGQGTAATRVTAFAKTVDRVRTFASSFREGDARRGTSIFGGVRSDLRLQA